MLLALIGWIIALALFGLVLSVGPWQKIIYKGLEILLVEAQIVILHFRKIVFWVTWFLVIDHVLLLVFVISDMHAAIITWAGINCLFYWLMVEATRAKIIRKFRQPLGYFFLIFATAGIAELFMPGLLKNGAWWFLGIVVVPLIIGQVFTLTQFKNAGFLGLKVLLIWIIFFSILALGDKFGDKFFTRILLNYDISNMDSDYVTWVRVIAKTGVYEMHKSGLGPFEDIDLVKTNAFPVNVGDILAMPVSKYNYDGGGMPSFVWNLSKFIPVVEVYDDYFGKTRYWIKAQSVVITTNPNIPENVENTLNKVPVVEKETTPPPPTKPKTILGRLLWEGTIGTDWVDTRTIANDQGAWLVPGDDIQYRISEKRMQGYTPSLREMDTQTAGFIYCSDNNPLQQTYKIRSLGNTQVVKIYSKN